MIEVGPGPGGLTRAILEAGPKQLTAIEKDARCLAALQPLKEKYGARFALMEEDALKVDITTMGAAPRVVIANLPYNVGTQLIIDWLQLAAIQGPAALTGFTVMLQKEVAERMVAVVGDDAYGRLSVIMQQLTDAAILFEVPPSAFTPPPKVTSAILRARILDKPREDVPLKALERVVAAAFNNRRKMLRQSLKSLGVDAVELCLTRPEAAGQSFNIGNPREAETTNGLARRIAGMVPGSRIERKVIERSEVAARVPRIDKARRLLGFEPKVDLEEGLARTLAWYRETGL